MQPKFRTIEVECSKVENIEEYLSYSLHKFFLKGLVVITIRLIIFEQQRMSKVFNEGK